ncbi:MAG TPA: class I SAM-dependent methyltransferase [Solirubrobacteraceae bacterium]|nr:class I SAM-dependent methyltransferase [Solirubrobacteraceae bacterium]
MVDWDAGSYEETTGPEIEPVGEVVVEVAAIARGDEVIDLAAGTGNAALAAARRGAEVTAIDGAPRLLAIAKDRAAKQSLTLDVREGDLLTLPAEDASADSVISVFGIIFASDPAGALREVRRVLRPGGRAALSAWIPAGPIDAMLGAVGRIVSRITGAPPPGRFAWHDPAVLGPVAAEAGLALASSAAHTLRVRDVSPEAYVERSRNHPMALAVAPAVIAAGADEELRSAQLSVLRPANEDPGAFLIHSPYVIHLLRPTAAGE